MQKKEDFVSNLGKLKPWDPIIKTSNGIIRLIPQYFNYPFVLKFVLAFILTYIIRRQDDTFLDTSCYILIAAVVIMIISKLSFCNTVHIEKRDKLLIVYPNILIRLIGKKKRVFKFDEIKRITTVSNLYSTGFWLAYRRYYLTLVIKDGEEIKMLSSSRLDTANKIAKFITSICCQ